MVGLVILLTLAVQSSGPSAPPAGRNGTDDSAANKIEVQDLIAHADDPKPATFPAPATEPPSIVVVAREQTSPPALPRQPSRYAEWAQDMYMKALEAPQMVSAFHSDAALQMPSTTQTGNGDANNTLAANSFQSSTDSSSVRLHPPASVYTVMTGSVIPAVLISGINSDLPGPILAQVSQNIYDSAAEGHSSSRKAAG
jgi:type IV secretory pathway VirB10-like protein